MSSTPFKELIIGFKETVEKKHRNLVKRKVKLDQYRGNLGRGEVLQPDQAKAIKRYDHVRSNIELLNDIIDNTNDFTNKFTELCDHLDEKLKTTQITCNTESCARLIFFQNFFQNLHKSDVKEAILYEFSDSYYEMAENIRDILSATIPENEFPTEGQSFDAFISGSCYKNRSLIINNFINRSSKGFVPKANQLNKYTQYTFIQAHDMCLQLIKNSRIQHAIQGKLFIEQINNPPEDIHVIQQETSNVEEEKLSESTQSSNDAPLSNGRFNFLHPSVVESTTNLEKTRFSSATDSTNSEDQPVLKEVDFGNVKANRINRGYRPAGNRNFGGHRGSNNTNGRPFTNGRVRENEHQRLAVH